MPLCCHAGAHPPPGLSVAAGVESDADGSIVFHYALRGPLAQVRLPRPAPGGRATGLWQHTCLEAFVRDVHGDAYVEFNFSPSGQWAFFAFDAYRAGMRDARADPPPVVTAREAEGVFELTARVAAAVLRDALPARHRRLALSAVIEDRDARTTYWALAHAPGKPDFHHAAGFTVNLEDVVS